jgi:chromosome segregation ATPase
MSDIDKVYDLLAQLYSEVQDGRKETKQRFQEVSQRLDSLETGQKKIETILEHDVKTKLKALHERAGDNTVKLGEHTERLDSIESKIDILAMSINSQDKRLEVVESRRKKAK